MFKLNLAVVLNTQRSNKKGEFPLRIRTTVNRVVSYHPLGIMITKEQWNGTEVIKHPDRTKMNSIIRNKVSEIEKIHYEHAIAGVEVKAVKKLRNPSFKEYAEKIISDQTGTLSLGRIEQRQHYLKKFVRFNPTIRIKDVTKETLIGFEAYCRGVGNNENTVHSNTSFVKSVLNAAVSDGLIDKSPAVGFKGAKYVDPMRESLSMDEIKRMEVFADNPKNNKTLRAVASWFLLGCFTGLRFSDMQNFEGIKDGRIVLQTVKTKAIVSIYATEQIKRACARLLDKSVFSNQKCNAYLKDIGILLNFDTKLTMHKSRHTYARIFISRGGNVYHLSKLLGHTSLKTTAIYAKLSDPALDAEMKRVFDE
jgi:site-specific recombinase XerD